MHINFVATIFKVLLKNDIDKEIESSLLKLLFIFTLYLNNKGKALVYNRNT